MADDSDASLITRPAAYKAGKAFVPGQLTVSRQRVSWQPGNAAAASAVSFSISSISGSIQKAKGRPLIKVDTHAGVAYIFQFDVEAERDSVLETVLGVQRDAQERGKAPAFAQPVTLTGPPALVERKKQLLSKDRQLQALFTELVEGGVISEPEFWRGPQRAALLAAPGTAPASQRAGLPSEMLSSAQPTRDGRTEQLTLSVTPEMIHQVFQEKPHVRAAYQASVPAVMTEEQFWTRYWRHEYALAARRRKRMQQGSGSYAEVEEEDELFMRFKPAKEPADALRARIQRVDPAVNLAADEYDSYLDQDGRGLAHDPGRDSEDLVSRAGVSVAIIHEINRHAQVVLDGHLACGLPADAAGAAAALDALRKAQELRPVLVNSEAAARLDEEAVARLRADVAMPDLAPSPPQAYAPLRITDPRRYFDNAEATAAAARPPCEQEREPYGQPASLEEVLEAVSARALWDPAVPPELAAAVLTEVGQLAACGEAGGLEGSAWLPRDPAAELLPGMQEQLRGVALTVAELLRHFWAALPAVTAAREAKLARLKEALAKTYTKVQAMKNTAQPGSEHQMVASVLKPVEAMLDAAFVRYDEELELRRLRGAQLAASPGTSTQVSPVQ